jgi:glycosyltransferase involved in cell wall biosynthesis
VDVFIPVYNDIQFLPHAVYSALNQCGVDVRVIVSDNASTDGTFEWVAALAEREPRLILSRNPKNLGHLANLNKYREMVQSPYYMLLCSDDMLLQPNALERAAKIMNEDETIATVYSNLVYIDARNEEILRRSFRREGFFSASDTLKSSLIGLRNMFGIPLLSKSDVYKPHSYPTELRYTGDAYLSSLGGEERKLFHLSDFLIGNRYTGKNLTSTLMSNSLQEFRLLESMRSVSLTPAERIMQSWNSPWVAFQKRLFLLWVRNRAAGPAQKPSIPPESHAVKGDLT